MLNEIPELDNRDFQQLVEDMIARIPVHTPEWNNFNQSDPGITVIHLFAYMVESLLYRSNRLPEAHRLKFLELLGIPLTPAAPGYGLVVFQNERGPVFPLLIDAGLELFAGKIPFRTRTPVNILPVSAEVFYKQPFHVDPELQSEQASITQANMVYDPILKGQPGDHYRSIRLEPPVPNVPLPDIDLRPNSSTLDGALWVALVAPKKVPLKAARAAIGGETLSMGIYPAIDIETAPLTPQPVDPTDAERFASSLNFDLITPSSTDDLEVRERRLTVETAENVLDMPGIVQIQLPDQAELTRREIDPLVEGTGAQPPLVEDRQLAQRIITWIRITAPMEDRKEQRPVRISWVGVNVARVIQALPVTQERIGIGSGTPNQRFKVANTPVILERSTTPGNSAPQPTFELRLVDQQGKPTTWKRIDDLNAADENDEVYSVDPAAGIIQCGDGLRGKRFPFGSVLLAKYEYGGGSQGQLAIGALSKAPALPGGIKVLNPVPTWGASDGETLADAQRKISDFLRHRDRLVTQEDFLDITLQTPGVDIGRVEALPLYDPIDHAAQLETVAVPEPRRIPGVVTILAVQDHPITQTVAPRANHLFRSAIRAWLERHRLITTVLYVREPLWVDVVVSVAFRLRVGHISATVKRDIGQALRTYLSPLVGGVRQRNQEYGEGYPLSAELRREDLIAIVSQTPGVRYVTDVQLALVKSIDAEGRRKKAEETDHIRFWGIQLPWLVNLSVEEGENAADPQALVDNIATPGGSTAIAVPVTPRECD